MRGLGKVKLADTHQQHFVDRHKFTHSKRINQKVLFYFIYLFTSLCLFCVHIVDMIEAVLGIHFHTFIDQVTIALIGNILHSTYDM